MTEVTTLVKTHWFVLVAAVLIGAFIRLLKADTVFPFTIHNKRWYAPLSIALGLVAAVVDHTLFATVWKMAILRGLFAGFLPVVGHDVMVKSVLTAVLSKAGFKDVPVGRLLSIDDEKEAKEAEAKAEKLKAEAKKDADEEPKSDAPTAP